MDNNWAHAIQAAESTLEDNISQIKKTTLWLTGHASVESTKDIIFLNAKIEYDDNEVDKFRFEVPQAMQDELDSPKAMMGYVVEFITNKLILPKYFDKFE